MPPTSSPSSGTAPSALLVVGGRQRRDAVERDEWQAYDRARIVRVDLRTGAVVPWLDDLGCAERLPSGSPSIVFKAASVDGDRMRVCTTTEVLEVELASGAVLRRRSHPWFNDLHHVVAEPSGELLVVSTGLDAVLRLDDDDAIVATYDIGVRPLRERFDLATDWRLVATTKPHETHPNYLFRVDGGWWATRFLTGDAIELAPARRTVRIALPRDPTTPAAGPHDGIVSADGVRFTTVDGAIVTVPLERFAEVGSAPRVAGTSAPQVDDSADDLARVELRDADGERATGWCRGLAPLADGTAWVGFSRIRPTAFRRHVSWLKHGLRRVGLHATAPTRIAQHDLKTGRSLAEIDLEPHGMAAVFSIHPLP